MASTIATVHTLLPGASFTIGYFDEDNIIFIQRKIKEVLKREYTQDILVDRGSIIKIMSRIIEERIEAVPKMNQRVVMTICSEFRRHQLEVDRNLKLEAHYVVSQALYDPTTENSKWDGQNIKLANRLGWSKVGGTSRFYFT